MQDKITGLLQYVGLIKRYFYDWRGLLACCALALSVVNVLLSPLKNLDELDDTRPKTSEFSNRSG
jgi:hypothetical protein